MVWKDVLSARGALFERPGHRRSDFTDWLVVSRLPLAVSSVQQPNG